MQNEPKPKRPTLAEIEAACDAFIPDLLARLAAVGFNVQADAKPDPVALVSDSVAANTTCNPETLLPCYPVSQNP